MEKWSFIGGLGTGSDCWWEDRGDTGEKGSFSFFFTSSLQWRMKTEESSTVFFSWIRVESVSFWELKKTKKTSTTGIWVAFHRYSVLVCFVCVFATQASGLFRYTCCVYPWSCCLFIIRPPYCEDAASVFRVSTTLWVTLSKQQYLLNSAHTTTHCKEFCLTVWSYWHVVVTFSRSLS